MNRHLPKAGAQTGPAMGGGSGSTGRVPIFTIFFVFLTLLASSPLPVQASGSPLAFTPVFDLGAPGGQAFLQDAVGFLWIGSDGGGLYRYDGYELKNYPAGPDGLSNGSVWRIIADPADPNALWIGTSGGLDRLDTARERFTHYRHDPERPDSLGNNTVQDIVADPADPDILWLGTAGGGLNRFSKSTGRCRRYEPDDDDPSSLAFGDVWRLVQDRRDPDILWVGTYGGGLDRFSKKAGTFAHFAHDPGNPNSLAARSNNVDSLIQDRDDPDILWIGSPDDGMSRFDTRTETFRHFTAEQTYGEVALIHDDGRGRLWLGGYVTNNGLTIFDKSSETFVNYRSDPKTHGGLSDDLIVNVAEDRSGIFWIVSHSGTVDKFDPHGGNFTLFRHLPEAENSLSHSAATTLAEDADGLVWIGTQGGLNRFDRATGRFTRYRHDPADPDSLDSDYVLGMLAEAGGELWVTVYVGPLIRFDRKAGRVGARYSGEAESLTRIVADPHDPDILWMGTHGAGLARFSKSKGSFRFYRPDQKRPEAGPANTYVQTLIHDRFERVLWMGGTFGGGLNRFDERSETFTHYAANPNDADSLSADAVAAIFEDDSGRLWVGTKGGGLNRFDRDSRTFIRYGRAEGVPPEVNAILPDGEGRLWLSTSAGIVRFDPATGAADRSYTRSDGLQGNSFLFGSALGGADGSIWFGGTGGLNRFYPDRLVFNDYRPPVILTALSQGGAPIRVGEIAAPWAMDRVALDWKRNFFEFEFAALNYTLPEKNRYRYILEGFDSHWYDADTRRFGRYSNLPGGHYILRVAGSNNDGLWSDRQVALSIDVATPWWARRAVQASGLALLALALTGGFLLRMRAMRRRTLLLETLVARRTRELTESNRDLASAKLAAEAANSAKSAFLANMSHELRSPLTAILGFSQLMHRSPALSPDQRQILDIIRRSGDHLLTLINQVLDLSKVEAGRAVLEESDLDLARMLTDLADMFRLRAEEKKLAFGFETDPSTPRHIRADAVKLRQALINLLNNAVKFTEAGSVRLTARTALDGAASARRLEFTVTDTGAGIAPEEMMNLFTPFSQTESGRRSQEGTGLGLPISRGFARLMGGDIRVESRPGEGSRFILTIPCRPAEGGLSEAKGQKEQVMGLAPGEAPRRILIVDDKAVNRELLRRMLTPIGFETMGAENGEAAVDAWRRWRPHLVWMDIRMPGMDGYEATRRIRELEEAGKASGPGAHDPERAVIVALTASAFESESKKALMAGCDDFMRKPFREHQIFDAMARHLGARYRYERNEDAPRVVRIDPERLRRLPPELRRRLAEAAGGGDVAGVAAGIGDVRAIDSGLAEGLSGLAEAFAYEAIIEVIAADVDAVDAVDAVDVVDAVDRVDAVDVVDGVDAVEGVEGVEGVNWGAAGGSAIETGDDPRGGGSDG